MKSASAESPPSPPPQAPPCGKAAASAAAKSSLSSEGATAAAHRAPSLVAWLPARGAGRVRAPPLSPPLSDERAVAAAVSAARLSLPTRGGLPHGPTTPRPPPPPPPPPPLPPPPPRSPRLRGPALPPHRPPLLCRAHAAPPPPPPPPPTPRTLAHQQCLTIAQPHESTSPLPQNSSSLPKTCVAPWLTLLVAGAGRRARAGWHSQQHMPFPLSCAVCRLPVEPDDPTGSSSRLSEGGGEGGSGDEEEGAPRWESALSCARLAEHVSI